MKGKKIVKEYITRVVNVGRQLWKCGVAEKVGVVLTGTYGEEGCKGWSVKGWI